MGQSASTLPVNTECSQSDIGMCLNMMEPSQWPAERYVPNIATRLNLNKVLTAGKSGAVIYRCTILGDAMEKPYVFKYYPGSVRVLATSIGMDGNYGMVFSREGDDRPYREITTICALSGLANFSCFHEFGVTKLTVNGKDTTGLYVLMNMAKGRPLGSYEPSEINLHQSVGISIKLLAAIVYAQSRLGENFEHFDLHPDNIFIDLTVCTPQEVTIGDQVVVFDCPNLTIIDYDLVSSSHYCGVYELELPEHKTKRLSTCPVPERTLAFTQKWVGTTKMLSLLEMAKTELSLGIFEQFKKEGSVSMNSDIANWYVISNVLLNRFEKDKRNPDQGHYQVNPCQNAKMCINTNAFLMQLYNESSVGPSSTSTKKDSSAYAQLRGQASYAATNAAVLIAVAGIKELTGLDAQAFERLFFQTHGYYPNFDSTENYIDAQRPETVSRYIQYKTNHSEILVGPLTSFRVLVHFNQMIPVITFSFDLPL